MISFLYKNLAKPLFFLFDAEFIHNSVTNFGEILGKFGFSRLVTKSFFYYANPRLSQTISGINFENPIGLSAGFDYEGRLTQILPSVGFGFETVGSITIKPYEGNPKPRLARLPKSRSLLVNKGLKNTGAIKIAKRLSTKRFSFPVGISIAKTNSKRSSTTELGTKDYVECFTYWEKTNIGDYYELNISCPNAFGGEPFTTPLKLTKLLSKLTKLNLSKPLFVKMPIDISDNDMESLVKVIIKYPVAGVVIGNLTKDRSNPALYLSEVAKVGKGNFSGKPTWERSNRHIRNIYKKFGKKLVIIGVGGVFSAEDAYYKISLGASLIELITGMVFEGPTLIGEINKGLIEIMEKNGKETISEVIGSI